MVMDHICFKEIEGKSWHEFLKSINVNTIGVDHEKCAKVMKN